MFPKFLCVCAFHVVLKKVNRKTCMNKASITLHTSSFQESIANGLEGKGRNVASRFEPPVKEWRIQ